MQLLKTELEDELQEQKTKYETMQNEHGDMLESMQEQLQCLLLRLKKTPQEHDERTNILEMLDSLFKKMEEASHHTKMKLEVLDEQIRKSREESINLTHSHRLNEFKEKMQRRQTLHTLEMASNKAKHLQQVLDLSGQLDSYKEQVENQQRDLQEANAKYQELEALAVMPHEAKVVLTAMEASNDESSTYEEVKTQVVEILKRMAIGYSRNQREKRHLESKVKRAQKREDASEEQLRHLRLQKEILDEETQIPPDDWREQLAVRRAAYKRQISEILLREENRLMEMELLEVRLTELAFLAVEIEDLQKELKENQEVFTSKIEKAQTTQESTRQSLNGLQSQVQDIMGRQRTSLENLLKSSGRINSAPARLGPEDCEITNLKTKLEDVSRLRRLEEELSKRDEELLKTKEELRLSQQRVQELEMHVGKQHRSDTDSTDQLSN
jgi:chromosome segregation ATPase